MFTIYYIKNKLTDEYYIGQTSNYEERMKEHKKNEKNPEKTRLGFAINKYGLDNFKFGIFCICNTQKEARDLEVYYINEYNSYLCGYNMSRGGELSHLGEKRTEEQRKNISIGTKVGMAKPEVKEKCKNGIRESYKNGREPWNKGKKTGPNPKITAAKKGKKQQRHIPADEYFKICSERSKIINADRHWYTNGDEDVRIHSDEIPFYVDRGYIKGRSKANCKNKKHKKCQITI